MRFPILAAIAFGALGLLSGCGFGSASAPGVLAREPVPLPPSVAGRSEARQARDEARVAAPRRRAITVPDRLTPPRPASP